MEQKLVTINIKRYLFWPLVLYVLLIVLIYLLKVDFGLSHYLYQLEGNDWSLKDHFFLETIVHKFGKYAAISFYLMIVSSYLLTFFKFSISDKLQPYRQGLLYLVVSTLTATLSVSFLKSITHIDCPWSISGLGGEVSYKPWLDILFTEHEGGKCFPAGHASAAYAFFSLFFFSKIYFSRYSLWLLLVVLSVGMLFGFSQQLRGAHFISHDLTTLIICWLLNLYFFYLFFIRKPNNYPIRTINNQ